MLSRTYNITFKFRNCIGYFIIKMQENENIPNKRTLRQRKTNGDQSKTKISISKKPVSVRKSPKIPKLEDNKSIQISSKSRAKLKEDPPDMEDIVWQPPNWEKVLDNIMQMRKLHIAPVDSMGCEQCSDSTDAPEVQRYQTLISLMLSSQTKDQVTHAAVQRLIAHGLTVENILNTSDEKLGELIYPVGFWKSKVKFIKKSTQILKDEYNGDIPSTLKDLCKLPGVGLKMANLAMSVGWNVTVGIAVDTHVHRISNRLGWVPKPTKDPEQTRVALEKWLPKDLWRPINFDMVGFGQTICQPIRPKCNDCLNLDYCPFGRTNIKNSHKK